MASGHVLQSKAARRPSLDDRWWRPFRKAGGAEVFHVDLSPQAARERAAFAWLDGEEQARWSNFRLDRPRREFALCRAALRVVLCERLACPNGELTFEDGEYGKPSALIRGQPAKVSFNISHSGRHGLIAMAGRGRLGVDVEPRDRRRKLDVLITEVLTPAEQSRLAGTGVIRKQQLFFRLWTMKEALVKALGKGFSLHISEFEIPPPMCNGQRLCEFRFPHLPEMRWRLENLGNREFAAAIAHECSPDNALPMASAASGEGNLA